MEKLELIKKNMNGETRWFVETGDGFDGTAQGWGYKSPQSLYKAYNYYKNKSKIKQKQNETKKYLRDNPDVKSALDDYFDEQNCFWRMKDGEEESLEDFVRCFEDKPDMIKKLDGNKKLWNSLVKYIQKNW